MPRLNQHEKTQMERVFEEDFARIEMAMNRQLLEHFSATREEVVESVGIKQGLEEASRLEKEIVDDKAELARMREKMQHDISQKERRLQDLKAQAVGEYSGPPSAEQLADLGLNDHDASIEKRNWFGFPIRTKLDAETAVRLKKRVNVGGPIQMLETIARSVKRELAFAATHEAAKAAYEKFYAMDFRRFGVDIAPMLGDFGDVKGERLLEANVAVDSKPKGLLGSGTR